MPWRMLDYYSLLYQHYGQAPQQQVLYVGEAPLALASHIAEATLAFHYAVIDIRTLDGEQLLASAVLEDNLLALLCGSDNPRLVVQRLLQRIGELPRPAHSDAVVALLILAELRRLHALVLEETKQMPITIDIMENPFLREAFEKGQLEGRQEGRQAGESALLCRQLEQRFGPLPAWARQQIEAAETATLETWGVRLLDATSLEDVLRAPSPVDLGRL